MATHTLLLYINLVSDWPNLRGSVLRSSMQRTLLIFRLKGFIRIFVSGSQTSVIAHMLLRLFSFSFISRSVFFKPLNRFE